jgi:hypothetical protein
LEPTAPAALPRLIAVAVTRWRTGEDHQLAGQATGLDARAGHPVTIWAPLTAICLAIAAAAQRQHNPSPPGRPD